MKKHRENTTGKLSRYGPFIAWALLIFLLSSIPAESLPHLRFFSADKIIHIIIYGILGYLARRAFAGSGSELLSSIWTLILLCVIYGVTDELHQFFVPGRTPSVFDLMADAVGAGLGVYFQPWIARKLKREKKRGVDTPSE